LVIGGGALGALLVLAAPVLGTLAGKASNRRLETCASGTAARPKVAAQVQLKKIMANRRQHQVDGLASSLIPNPALLRQRLAMTGKGWTLPQYVGLVRILLVVIFGWLIIAGRRWPRAGAGRARRVWRCRTRR
jgi:tight adherence protein B